MDPHFDAERLAALADGSLSTEERAAAEAHAVDCPRCLQLLAAMARTDASDVAGAVPAGWRLWGALRWAVPAAAAATAVALWLGLDPGDRTAPPETTVSERADTTPAPVPPASPAPAPGAKEEASPAPAAPVRAPSGPAERDRLSDERRSRSLESRSLEARPPSVSADAPASARQPPKPADSPQAKAIEAPPLELLRQRPTSPQPVPRVEESPVPIPAARPERVQSGAASARAAAPPIQQQVETPSPIAETVTVFDSAAPLEIVSSDPSNRWRIRGPQLDRSRDAGKTWVRQPPVFGAQILAGSSPAAEVLWLVGRRGVVIVTADGITWQRLQFPQSVDLTGVRAQSGVEAELTTADGRVFRVSREKGTLHILQK
jgi:hypothetical protein